MLSETNAYVCKASKATHGESIFFSWRKKKMLSETNAYVCKASKATHGESIFFSWRKNTIRSEKVFPVIFVFQYGSSSSIFIVNVNRMVFTTFSNVSRKGITRFLQQMKALFQSKSRFPISLIFWISHGAWDFGRMVFFGYLKMPTCSFSSSPSSSPWKKKKNSFRGYKLLSLKSAIIIDSDLTPCLQKSGMPSAKQF